VFYYIWGFETMTGIKVSVIIDFSGSFLGALKGLK
jgi:hypothetical protein